MTQTQRRALKWLRDSPGGVDIGKHGFDVSQTFRELWYEGWAAMETGAIFLAGMPLYGRATLTEAGRKAIAEAGGGRQKPEQVIRLSEDRQWQQDWERFCERADYMPADDEDSGVCDVCGFIRRSHVPGCEAAYLCFDALFEDDDAPLLISRALVEAGV